MEHFSEKVCRFTIFDVYFFIADRAGEWLQVDLRSPSRITGVITQGSGRTNNQWVRSFTVSYGNSSFRLTTIRDTRGNKVHLSY